MSENYTPNDIEKILKIAIQKQGNQNNFSRSNLYEIARELNLDPNDIDRAISEYEVLGDLDYEKEVFMNSRKKEFYEHLAVFSVINVVFLIVSMFVDVGQPWSYLFSVGWLVGLIIDGIDKFRYDEEKFQKHLKNKKLKEKGYDILNSVLGFVDNKLKGKR